MRVFFFFVFSIVDFMYSKKIVFWKKSKISFKHLCSMSEFHSECLLHIQHFQMFRYLHRIDNECQHEILLMLSYADLFHFAQSFAKVFRNKHPLGVWHLSVCFYFLLLPSFAFVSQAIQIFSSIFFVDILQ